MATSRKVEADGVSLSWKRSIWFSESQHEAWKNLTQILFSTGSPQFYYLHGDSGTGKSWLLHQFTELCRQDRVPGQSLVALIDFEQPPDRFTDLRLSLFAFLEMRRQLEELGPVFPLFDLATLVYFYKSGQFVPTSLARHYPENARDWIFTLAECIFTGLDSLDGDGLLKLMQRFRVDLPTERIETLKFGRRVEAIKKLRYEFSLQEEIPGLLLVDLSLLNTFEPGRRILFCFDHVEGMLPSPPAGEAHFSDPLAWLFKFWSIIRKSSLPVHLVAAGRNPLKRPNRTQDAGTFHVLSLSPLHRKDTRRFVEQQRLDGTEARAHAVNLARIEELKYSPLRLATACTILRWLTQNGDYGGENGKQETYEHSQINLCRYLFGIINRDIATALVALAACRHFDAEVYTYLSKYIVFNANAEFFKWITDLPFVKRIRSAGSVQYRMHEDIKAELLKAGRTLVQRAQNGLYHFYAQRALSGDLSCEIEALYMLFQLDFKAGVKKWLQRFNTCTAGEQYQCCQRLIALLAEIPAPEPLWQARINQALAVYFEKIGASGSAEKYLSRARLLIEARKHRGVAEEELVYEQGRLLLKLAWQEYRKGAYAKSEELLNSILQLAARHRLTGPIGSCFSVTLARVYILLSRIYQAHGTFNKAVDYQLKAAETAERTLEQAPGFEPAWQIYLRLQRMRAQTLFEQFEVDGGFECLDRTLEKATALKAERQQSASICEELARLHELYGQALKERAEYRKALEHFSHAQSFLDEALRIAAGRRRSMLLKSKISTQIAEICLWLSDTEAADQYIDQALQTCEMILPAWPQDGATLSTRANALYVKALAFQHRGEREKATECFAEAESEFLRVFGGHVKSVGHLRRFLQFSSGVMTSTGTSSASRRLYQQLEAFINLALKNNGNRVQPLVPGSLLSLLLYHRPEYIHQAEALFQKNGLAADRLQDWCKGKRLSAQDVLIWARVLYERIDDLINRAEFRAAETLLNNLLAFCEWILQKFPQNPYLNLVAAEAAIYRGQFLLHKGDTGLCTEIGQRACELLEDLCQSYPHFTVFKESLIRGQLKLAEFKAALGHYQDALNLILHARSNAIRLKEEAYDTVQAEHLIGLCSFEQARLKEILGHRTEALESFSEAERAFEQVIACDPTHAEARQNLDISRFGSLMLNPPAEKEESIETCMASLEKQLRQQAGYRFVKNILVTLCSSFEAYGEENLKLSPGIQKLFHRLFQSAAEAVKQETHYLLQAYYVRAYGRWKALLKTSADALPALPGAKDPVRAAENLLKKHPQDFELQEVCATIFLEQGVQQLMRQKFERARELFRKAGDRFAALMEAGFGSLPVLYRRGVALANIGFCLIQEQQVEEALKTFGEAVQNFQKTAEVSSTFTASRHWLGDLYLGIGTLFLQIQRREQCEQFLSHAVQEFEWVLNQQPDHPTVLANLGRAHLELGEFHKASHDFPRALWHYKKAIEVFQQARAAQGAGHATLKRLAECYSDLADLQMELSQYQDADQNYYEAIRHYNEILQLRKDDVEALYGCAISHANLGRIKFMQTQLDGAIREYRKAADGYRTIVERVADYRNARLNLGMTLANLGHLFTEKGKLDEAITNYNEAASIFDRCLDTNKKDWSVALKKAQVLRHLGKCYLANRFYDSAQIHLDKAIQLFTEISRHAPEHLDIAAMCESYLELGTLLEGRGELDKAVRGLEQGANWLSGFIARNPDNMEYLYHHGVYRFKFGEFLERHQLNDRFQEEYKAAFDSLYSAFKLNPNEPQIRLLLQEIKAKAEKLNLSFYAG